MDQSNKYIVAQAVSSPASASARVSGGYAQTNTSSGTRGYNSAYGQPSRSNTKRREEYPPQKEKEPKRSAGRIMLSILCFFLGLTICLYPHVAQYINNLSATKMVANYEQAILQMGDEEAMNAAGTAFSEEGMFGSLFIPKLNLDLPIFVGSTNANLSRGIAHLEGTSLPTGGENTHAVLAGHNGAVAHEWFTNINKLEEGDLFYIRHEGLTLTYQVESTRVIAPTETSALRIQEGRDLVTLLTCIDSGKNRLLVTGERVFE